MSLTNYAETMLLSAFSGSVVADIAATYVQLHIGDPGEDATANPADETTRQAVTWDAASGGIKASAADVSWVDVAATEEYSHVSIWDDPTAGNPLWYGEMAASKEMNEGDTFTIAAGDLTIALD